MAARSWRRRDGRLGFGSAGSGAKGRGDKCRSFKVKGGWWREGKAACALCRKPGHLPEDLPFSFYGVSDMNFRACGKKRLIIKREILPIYLQVS